jgi:hypothetical protein
MSLSLWIEPKMEQMSDFMDFVKKLSKHIDNGGSYCGECGIFFPTRVAGRKHDFAEHYEYALAQCGGNKKKLKEWMDLPDT